MNATDAKRERIGYDKLNKAERVVTLVSYGRFEIENGTLSQFYWNSTGYYAAETVWAFEQIGAIKAADVLRRANSRFPGGAPSKDESVWKSELEKLDDDALDALTSEFYRVEDEENLDGLLDEYIRVHRSELPEPED